jgi:hypothetical protein
MKMGRWLPVAVLVAVAALEAMPGGTSMARCASPRCAEDRLRGANGEAAIDRLGGSLPTVARSHGWSEAKLRSELRRDHQLHVDPQGGLYYAEEELADASTSVATSTEPFPVDPVSDVFKLHSLPGAPKSGGAGSATAGVSAMSSARRVSLFVRMFASSSRLLAAR